MLCLWCHMMKKKWIHGANDAWLPSQVQKDQVHRICQALLRQKTGWKNPWYCLIRRQITTFCSLCQVPGCNVIYSQERKCVLLSWMTNIAVCSYLSNIYRNQHGMNNSTTLKNCFTLNTESWLCLVQKIIFGSPPNSLSYDFWQCKLFKQEIRSLPLSSYLEKR